MKVLFVCTGNTCRSPMAEYIARDEAEKRGIDAVFSSAGLFPGSRLSSGARAAIKKLTGIDASHDPRPVTNKDFEQADLVIGISSSHAGAIRNLFGDREGLISMPEDIPDPFGCDDEEYLACAEKIKEGIIKLFEDGIIH
ncbi:MAG: low molecular weight protein arginine phosphatase [Clostridia bacterium]|nr:low molecular weight protein arginine phosphatase [Clostridia bacterium]